LALRENSENSDIVLEGGTTFTLARRGEQGWSEDYHPCS